MTTKREKILVFRRGSLGDGVLSLPALHALDHLFQSVEMRVLTNSPVDSRMAPMQDLLGGNSLVSGFFVFPARERGAATWWDLARQIRAWGPKHVAYLSEPSRPLALAREAVFFALCGVRHFIGLPFGPDLRTYRRLGERLWESEAQRLLRATGAESPPRRPWDMKFGVAEGAEAAALVRGWAGRSRFIVACAGGKRADQDWGDANWRAVLGALSERHPDLGLAFVGATEEAERADRLAADWRGPTLNLCGRTAPRVAGLVMRRALFYLGHDSGPMHLAALVGIPCVAVINARAKPGVWFPQGDGHTVFYPWDLADSVPATAGFRDGGTTISTIPPGPVAEACLAALGGTEKMEES